MKSIEIFLPLNAYDGTPFPDTVFGRIEDELTETFGGVTAYKRAPAQGRWKSGGQTQGDEVAIFEVVDRLDRGWWKRFREELEDRLGQETILSRRGTSRSCKRCHGIKRPYRCGLR